MNKIKVINIESKKLTTENLKRLYDIMEKYYNNMRYEIFVKDIQEKDVTFLLIDKNNYIQGFTSIVIYSKIIENKKIAAVFSGDTIVDKEFRGTFDLPFAWLRYVYNQKEKYDKMFWFMLSKGYRTYRLLPRFFKEHYPTYKKETPESIKDIVNIFAFDKFGDKYNSLTNIYIPSYNYYLKSGKEEIKKDLLKNPDINFFFKKNPKFWIGHELVNYADFDMKNLTLYGLIFVRYGNSFLIRSFTELYKKISKIFK